MLYGSAYRRLLAGQEAEANQTTREICNTKTLAAPTTRTRPVVECLSGDIGAPGLLCTVITAACRPYCFNTTMEDDFTPDIKKPVRQAESAGSTGIPLGKSMREAVRS
jgi:hypothetical protein